MMIRRNRRHPLGLWLSLLAIFAQLMAPLGHAAMLSSPSGDATASAAICLTASSPARQRMEQALPVELRQALQQGRLKSRMSCCDCLSAGSPPLPLASLPAIAVLAGQVKQPQAPFAIPGRSPSLQIPPATGPPIDS